MTLFNKAYQRQQRLHTPYESPDGFTHVNEAAYCSYCKRDTRQAVSTNKIDRTAADGSKRIIRELRLRDCLSCENTTSQSVSEETFYYGGAK